MAGSGLDALFARLFNILGEAGYEWEPMIPDRLVECRKHPEHFTELQRFFGLGGAAAAGVRDEELETAGVPRELIAPLRELAPAVSRWKGRFIAHTHWPHMGQGPHAGKGEGVYAGRESFELARRLDAEAGYFEGKRVLDLGSGSGALAISLSDRAARVQGFESSLEAVEWSSAAARAQGLAHLAFAQGRIGTPETESLAESLMEGERWDAAVFNPPFAIPSGAPRPVRDGGELGIALPLKFLEFAHQHLVTGARAFCFVTNPIVKGHGEFFERLGRDQWSILKRELKDERFNQSIYRKEGYAEKGIERVELWYLVLETR